MNIETQVYGVKDISQKVDKVIVNLTYSPRAATLKRKFGNLPVRYMRTKIESEEEFKLLEQIDEIFSTDEDANDADDDDDDEVAEAQQQQQASASARA
ncbi:unnamed protein product [Ceutorhynchus assimilis]|uniref:Uncharacterized protein n=1 Tax=Ceutorhynchus assimilis TaxID=467358 RepID=A0A9P0DRJ3_9CUCU|nr:unnamed protein product [Ceutorhynchus assimilis]